MERFLTNALLAITLVIGIIILINMVQLYTIIY